MTGKLKSILSLVVLIALLILPIVGVIKIMNAIPQYKVFCTRHDVAVKVTPQTDFWGTSYYVENKSGQSSMEDEIPKIGVDHCSRWELVER